MDLGPVSLVEYLRHAEDLLLLPGMAIGCDGPVLSCTLVSSLPLRELGGRRVELGSTSRTTVELARLLIEERTAGQPLYRTSEPDLPAMLARSEAAVVIGDTGLRSHFHGGRLDGHAVHDLGGMWKERTGHPMVFAVWAVRRDFAERHEDAVHRAHASLLAARDLADEDLAGAAGHAAELSPFSRGELETYFRSLRFDLTDDMREGMRVFAEAMAERGVVEGPPVPREFPVGEHTGWNRSW
ncbi:menaquinone biosynthesis protein [Nocardiopsis sp. ARC36]